MKTPEQLRGQAQRYASTLGALLSGELLAANTDVKRAALVQRFVQALERAFMDGIHAARDGAE